MPEQKPSIGRIVHYQSHGSPNGQHLSEPRAAIVTAVFPEVDPNAPEGTGQTLASPTVSLCIVNPTGFFFDRAVPFSETPKAGHWNWPPYVAPSK